MRFAVALLIAAVAAKAPVCHKQGKCDKGYHDITDGKGNYWACGNKCNHGRRLYTNGSCVCACSKAPDQCNSDGTLKKADPVCFKRGKCHKGYMDKTNGKGHWWRCGAKCSGGRNMWTDGSCNCACRKDPDPKKLNCVDK